MRTKEYGDPQDSEGCQKPVPNPIASPFTKELLLLATTTSVSTVGPLKTNLLRCTFMCSEPVISILDSGHVRKKLKEGEGWLD